MIPLCVPNLTDEDREALSDCIDSGHVGPGGQTTQRFERRVADISERKWAIATITGTAALHTSLKVLGFDLIDSPNEVVISKAAFPAVKNILKNMAINIREVDDGVVNHDVALIKNPTGDKIVADRAPDFGGPTGTEDLCCYSFAANKIVTCGQGGAIVGDDMDLYRLCREIIHQGFHDNAGKYNYRMADLNAALGLSQLGRLNEYRDMKSEIWEQYNDWLPMIDRGESRWMSTVACDYPDDLVNFLRDHSIESRAEQAIGGVSLPCSTSLKPTELNMVKNLVERFLS